MSLINIDRQRSNFWFSTVVFCALILTGCATVAAKKTGTGIQESNSGAATRQRAGEGKLDMASRQPESGSSSLDALRKGKEATSGRLKVIHFECDRYDLSADARATLKAHADRLRANPGVNVEIEGHCDERCTTEYNLALGTKRAHATQEYLVSLGIASSRIKTVSYGEELPGCKERDENCYRKNRRDCFVDQRPHPGA